MVIVGRPIGMLPHRPRLRRLGDAFRFLLALFLCNSIHTLFLSLPVAAATQYYVDSVHGADSNPGMSPEQSWQTLAPVKARRFAPGDVINLRRGSAWEGELTIYNSGREGQPIRYTAYGEGDRPVIRNPHGGDGGRGVTIEASWVIVEGIAVERTDGIGILIYRGAHHNVIQDCYITDVGAGIGVLGEHNLITRNVIERLHAGSGAIGVDLGASYNEVSYNRMAQCIAPSETYGTDGGAIELYGSVNGSYIHHNWAHDNNGFIEIGGGEARDTVVAYNVALDNGLFLCLNLGGAYGSQVSNLRVEQNTIVQGESDLAGALLAFNNADPSPSTLALRNNVFYVTGSQMVTHKSTIAHDHNLYYLTRDKSYLGFDLRPDELLADPLFVDLAAGNLHLRPGSPAIDAGANLGHPKDLDGVSVPSGSAPDLGAYEFAAPTAVATDTPKPTPTQTRPVAMPTPTEPVATLTPPQPKRYRVVLPVLLKQSS